MWKFEKLTNDFGWLYWNGKRMLLSRDEAAKLKTEKDVAEIWDWRWEDTSD